MRLSKIKLAGFKSFADPTVLTVSANLTGIVGPNGCGKSNIIDAVIWVLSGISAKYLRGDSMTDVIFNGSTTRGPTGNASVELIFDNHKGEAGGQYAGYNEISVKRQINREAVSTYYLNGARCRRKDIQAIFLGTGLGHRNYAIIEQGTISRLIEAKPEELRTLIEEAAGISKYKERRRETINRTKHTKENISRLADIRAELSKQLEHLQQQAKIAEKYQILKKEERYLRAELTVIGWKNLDTRMHAEKKTITNQENSLEAEITELRQLENSIEKYREKLVSANDDFNKLQADFYGISGKIVQYEENIKHNKQTIESMKETLQRVQQETDKVNGDLQQDRTTLEDIIATTGTLKPKMQTAKDDSAEAYKFLQDAEQTMQNWQNEWDEFNEQMADHSKQQQHDETRVHYLQENISELTQRRQALEQELNIVGPDSIQSKIKEHEGRIKETKSEQEQLADALAIKNTTLTNLYDEIQRLNQQINQYNQSQKELEGRLSSLESLQQSLSGENRANVKDWLLSMGLDDSPRLAQKLKVEPEWLHAVETVLKEHLQDIVVDDDKPYITRLSDLNEGELGMIIKTEQEQNTVKRPGITLLKEKINKNNLLNDLLNGIYIANDIEEAQLIRTQLESNESVITRDCIWLGCGWSKIYHDKTGEKNILTRSHEIEQCKSEHETTQKQLSMMGETIKNKQSSYDLVQKDIDNLSVKLQQVNERLAEYQATLITSQARNEQIKARAENIRDEFTDIDLQMEDSSAKLQTLRENLQNTSGLSDEMKAQRACLLSLKEKHLTSLHKNRRRWQNAHETSYEIGLQLASANSEIAALEKAIQRNQVQLKELQERNQKINEALIEEQAPLAQYHDELDLKIKNKIEIERSMKDARAVIQDIDDSLREFEQQRSRKERTLQGFRKLLEESRLTLQESRIRLKTMEQQLQSEGHQLKTMLKQLAKDADIDIWGKRLEKLTKKIQRLGLINLAAIDECSQLSERKNYLDSQNQDLMEALKTLENAVHKIDKETKTKFKETFDQLNANIKNKFIQLFGGGNVYLELSCDDLLQTGVTIMANPPGKRNRRINLLSGGEKALTAIALIFSIFELNPAPFCILDEVDAPLDDVNATRFSEMVKHMSKEIQFIIITHNKITMEMVHQLLGVTVQEQGISRLISVNIDEAAKMAASA